jgi:dihydrodipicolinate synthase/N-acetylneuraminate lyase
VERRASHGDLSARLKEVLVLLGELASAAVRPPLLPLDAADRERVALALEAALFVPARPAE